MLSFKYREISKNTYVKEHLRTAASKVILGRDCLRLFFWTVAFKTILTYNIIKIPVVFKPELQTLFICICPL